jgi:hypothetical protein
MPSSKKSGPDTPQVKAVSIEERDGERCQENTNNLAFNPVLCEHTFVNAK